MSCFSVLFLGTPDFAGPLLQTLVEDDFFNVVGVITQSNENRQFNQKGLRSSLVKKRRKSRSSFVENLILKKAWDKRFPLYKPVSVNGEDALRTISSWGADFVLVVAFGQILGREFLELFPNKVLNIHASLLPCWRGAAPIQRAIMAGDRETGVSLQVVDEKLDTGPVLGERVLKGIDKMDAKEVHDQLKFLARDLLCVELKEYLNGNLKPVLQEDIMREKGRVSSYAHKIKKSEAFLQWERSAEFLSSQVRALSLNSGAMTLRKGKILKIHKAEVYEPEVRVNEDHEFFSSGQVSKVGKSFFLVSCGRGYLKVFEVQPESRSRMKVEEFLKGYGLKLGETFEVIS